MFCWFLGWGNTNQPELLLLKFFATITAISWPSPLISQLFHTGHFQTEPHLFFTARLFLSRINNTLLYLKLRIRYLCLASDPATLSGLVEMTSNAVHPYHSHWKETLQMSDKQPSLSLLSFFVIMSHTYNPSIVFALCSFLEVLLHCTCISSHYIQVKNIINNKTWHNFSFIFSFIKKTFDLPIRCFYIVTNGCMVRV